jgi:hypothetical protein
VVNLSALIGSWDTDATKASVDANASGQYNGWFGITRTGGQIIFNPQPVNMLTMQLAYSLKPFVGLGNGSLDNFSIALVGTGFLRPNKNGPITESGLDPASQANYLATEVDLNLAWRLSSDLGLGLGGGLLIPNTEAMSRKLEGKIQFSLSWAL